MKEIIFGMAIGALVGAMLYKNCQTVKKAYDKGEELIITEISKMDTSKSK